MTALELLGAEDLGARPLRGGGGGGSIRRPSMPSRAPASTVDQRGKAPQPAAPAATAPEPSGGGGGGGGGTTLLDTGPPEPEAAPTPAPAPMPAAPMPAAPISAPAPTPTRRTFDTDRDWYRQQARERDYYRGYDYPQYQYEYPSYYYAPPVVVTEPVYAYSDELAEEETMDDYEVLGADELGFDYSALLKGAGGLLSGVAEGFGDKKAATPPPPPPPPPSNTWKYVAVGVGGLGVLGLIIVLATRK